MEGPGRARRRSRVGASLKTASDQVAGAREKLRDRRNRVWSGGAGNRGHYVYVWLDYGHSQNTSLLPSQYDNDY